jgi:hypothetical protein
VALRSRAAAFFCFFSAFRSFFRAATNPFVVARTAFAVRTSLGLPDWAWSNTRTASVSCLVAIATFRLAIMAAAWALVRRFLLARYAPDRLDLFVALVSAIALYLLVHVTQAMGQHAYDFEREIRCLLHQELETSLVDRDELTVRPSNRSGAAWFPIEQRHLAEYAPGTEGFDYFPVDGEVHLSFLHNVHDVTGLPLGEDWLACRKRLEVTGELSK